MPEVYEIPPPAAPAVEGVAERWVEIDGARMRYLQAGSGPALILLHGLLGYSFSWRYAMPALAPYATTYAPDMLGAGFSDRPRGIDHSVPATARRVLQLIEMLGISSFDLLGTSRGGIVATAMAAACVEGSFTKARLRRLILVCPVNPYSPHGQWIAPFCGTRFGGAAVRFVLEQAPGLYPYVHSRLFADKSKIPPGSLDGYKAPLAIPGLFDHALSIVKTWTKDLQEQQSLLPRLRDVPTLLMWGTKDPAVYFSSMKPLARHFKNVQTVAFPGAGHLPYEECPEEFNRELLRYINSEQ